MKIRKIQKGRINSIKRRRRYLIKGEIGIRNKKEMILKEKEYKMINNSIIKAIIKKGISKQVEKIELIKNEKNWLPYTKKGILVRMGKGKGKIEGRRIRLKQKSVIIEIKILSKNEKKLILTILYSIFNKILLKYPKFQIISRFN